MSELMERLAGAKIFTKLDLKNGYNLVRIKEGEEWKTAFRTRYGLYEYLVMPFGLCNAPASFQAMMNEILSDLLDAGVIVYIDDVLIYSETEEEHKVLVRKVIQRLKDHNLCAAIDKSVFHVSEVDYLGFVVGVEGIKMNQKKIEEILAWKRPMSVKNVQSFLGFANFYRRFILNYSMICRPLTELTKKDVHFFWTPECEEAFEELKRRFTTGPILVHFHSDRKTVVETDASDFALGCVLSQVQLDNSTHPVGYHSRKFKSAELNYDVHDKEMLAIVVAFKEWEHMLKSVKDQIVVFTDHKNLEYFNTTKILSRRQARWNEHMAEFNYKIVYRPGDKNTKADVLSRRWDYAPEGGSSKTELAFFKPGQLDLGDDHVPAVVAGVQVQYELAGNFVEELLKAALLDQEYCNTRELVKKGAKVVDKRFTVTEGDLLLYENRYVVPKNLEFKLKVLRENHDSKVAGHFGQTRTLLRLRDNFYWKGMDDEVRTYVRECDTCQRDKTQQHKKFGLLQPLEIPDRPWQSISMDFIVGLPESEGNTQIWVVVCRLSKMAHFIALPTQAEVPTRELAKTFAKEIWRLHGLPAEIVSDRDPKFMSHLWQDLMEHLDVQLSMSTAAHAQTDGQTERMNQTLEAYLRHYCSFMQDDWVDLLPLAEYAYNSSVQESTKLSPFYVNYAFQPETQWLKAKEETAWTSPAAELLYSRWISIWSTLKENIRAAQERMKKYYDRKAQEAPEMKVGDLALLSAKNIRGTRPSAKLDHKAQGPFKILEAIGTRAFRLQLPPQWKMHNVFHVSLLEPYHQSSIPGRVPPPPPPVLVEQEEEWEVEAIAKSRFNRKTKRVEYLTMWKGYPKSDATWEPASQLVSLNEAGESSLPSALVRFHKRYRKSPVDSTVEKILQELENEVL
jgi:hypothetical protein